MSAFDVDVASSSQEPDTPRTRSVEGSAVGQRELLIQNDQVKFIAALLDHRRPEKIDFAGRT
jgi:hypothetical protein